MKAKIYIIVSLLILSFYLVGCSKQSNLGADLKAIPQELRLKTDKEKIVYSEDIELKERKVDGSLVTSGTIKSYEYISDVEVKDEVSFNGNDVYSNTKIAERKGNKIIYHIYSSDVFYRDVDDKVYEIKTATTTIDAFDIQTKETIIDKVSKLFGNKVLADNYSPAVDGICEHQGTTYSTVSQASACSSTYKTNAYATQWFGKSGSTYYLARSFYTFNTSLINDGYTVTAASLHIWGYSRNAQTSTLNIYESTQASPTDLVVGDFDQYNTTAFSDTAIAANSWATGENSWTFNSSGIAKISKTGYTMLAMLYSTDYRLGDTAPTGEQNVGIRFVEYTTTTERPYLSVTASAPITTNEVYIINFDI